MDLNLPDTDGAVAIQAIVEQDPSARIIVLTMYDNEERLLRALRCAAARKPMCSRLQNRKR